MDSLFFIQLGLGIISALIAMLYKLMLGKFDDLHKHDLAMDSRLSQIEIAIARIDERLNHKADK